MKPKSMWQRGRSSVNFSFKKSKYDFKVSNFYDVVTLICFSSAYCWSILQTFSIIYLVAMFLHIKMVILSMII